ncbi:hypothetical protein CH371_20110 [Leptospira wolffii]|uniref:Uncharacterized protein n=1 Tax=Leptospira wolffii TaxID=409998 RepID=A0A2M9Z6J9_9LEPT|nr:hypothetical protein [Leptospira wolffii]PJZ64063.1 hypothetical protein CH371_20110 [Leptospira wolffii]
MENKKIKWLIYTVLVGLIPVLSRLLIWSVTKTNQITAISASDFISFGLILHISNINEIEHLEATDKSWKTIQNGTSIAFIAMYSVLFALLLFKESNAEMIDLIAIERSSLGLSIVSFIISFSVFHRISKLRTTGE